MYVTRVIRKTSPYNKYIKWFCEGESEETGARFSFGYRTRKEAEAHAWKSGRLVEVRTRKSIFLNPAYKASESVVVSKCPYCTEYPCSNHDGSKYE